MMTPGAGDQSPRRILFAGYAPVHFLCFLPVYRLLQQDQRLEFRFSGGFRSKNDGQQTFSLDGFYPEDMIDPIQVIPLEQSARENFQVVVCAHTGATMVPESAQASVQIFHGVSFKNFAVREKVLAYDYLCLPGAYHARKFAEQNLIRAGGSRCLVTGFAKADALTDHPADRSALLSKMNMDPDRPTVLYAPTGGKNNSLETMGEDLMELIAADGSWNLLVKPHDHPKRAIDWSGRLASLENDRVRVVRDRDIVPFMQASDLLISDASSVAVEYTLLDRPMVFLDVPRLLKNVVKRGGALDLETYGRKIGQVATTPEEAVAAVRQGLAQPRKNGALRRAMAADVFYRPGTSTQRVAAVVRHAAGIQPELPADIQILNA